MAKAQGDGMAALVKQVETRAKKLGGEIRSTLDTAVKQLRKIAAATAEQVEKYAHEAVKELQGGEKPAQRGKRKAGTARRSRGSHAASAR